MSLLRFSQARCLPRAADIQVRTYAAKGEPAGDPKKEIIRRVLYPSNMRNPHHTIERAWLLHRRHLRKKRESELARKFECMRKAMEELERLDSRLFMEANKQEDPRARSTTEMELMKTLKSSEVRTLEARVRGLFPREMRIPIDTPSRTGWNYDWKPFPRPL
ncbi:hypothetical protein BD779DRAFT_1487276 [Infundibulicybe gibba]|nr:hypothetical protein BD779DRAFT_1487276 [Infundibulicybe gibba]